MKKPIENKNLEYVSGYLNKVGELFESLKKVPSWRLKIAFITLGEDVCNKLHQIANYGN